MPLVPADRRSRCLDIGCSVGRSALEFARHFGHVDAIDFSARFIQSGVRLQEGAEVLYEVPTEGELTDQPSRVARAAGAGRGGAAGALHAGRRLQSQADLHCLRPVFAGNLIDRLYDPALFLAASADRLAAGGLLVITSPYTWLEEYTPKEKWLGGRREHGEPVTTFEGLERILTPRLRTLQRQDMPFVIRETARKHQHSVAELTAWRRQDGSPGTL